MRTSLPGIYAAGDCVEVVGSVHGQGMIAPLGSLANRQGRVVGDNLGGLESEFGPVAGSIAVKVFDLNVAATGMTRVAAQRAGIDVRAVWGTFGDIAHYYPEDKRLYFEMVYEAGSGRLIGLQGVGAGDVVRRVDVFASLLLRRATIGALLDLEFAYAPPYASAMDPLHYLGSLALAQEREGMRALEPTMPLEGKTVLDVRLESEAKDKPIGGGNVVVVPMAELSTRLGELPEGELVVICEKGPRSMDALRRIVGAGRSCMGYVGGGRTLRHGEPT